MKNVKKVVFLVKCFLPLTPGRKVSVSRKCARSFAEPSRRNEGWYSASAGVRSRLRFTAHALAGAAGVETLRNDTTFGKRLLRLILGKYCPICGGLQEVKGTRWVVAKGFRELVPIRGWDEWLSKNKLKSSAYIKRLNVTLFMMSLTYILKMSGLST